MIIFLFLGLLIGLRLVPELSVGRKTCKKPKIILYMIKL